MITAITTTNDTSRELAAPAAGMLAAYLPSNYTEAMAIAGTLGKAAGLPADVAFLKMAAGAAIGIDPVAALQTIDVIDGPNGTKQPGYRARLMVALCLRAKGICEYFECVESDATHATWRAKRVGRPERVVTYGMEDAQRAKLVKAGGAYEKDPESQFNARASARLARLVFSDIVLNMYTREELEEAAESVRPAPATVAPLPRPAERIADAVVIDGEALIVAALAVATNEAELKALAADAVRRWPKERPAAVKAAHAAAKERIAAAKSQAAQGEPPHDPATGVVEERTPGEEG